ncbi:MAG: HDOD domain-containing protein [Ignavibacteriales bacterium]|nr:MAG: HDOD domain-containing protein [Ignavibacteriales bacterium]
MISILFVDDEENIILGLKRMLRPMKREWNLYFAESGEEALRILATEKIDIIVTDMRMPKMDGATLLQHVKKEYPGITRIILSGYSEKEFIMRTSSTAHQFLPKPCDLEILKSAIYRLIKLRQLVLNPKIKEKVSIVSNLPSLPKLYHDLENELNSNTVSLKKIGNIISQDLSMTAKILQMVNSAFFGLPQAISDIIQAVSYLGVDTIKSLVLFHHLFTTYDKDEEMTNSLKALWSHSLYIANISKKILSLKVSNAQQVENAFIAGMLHDIGKLILLQIPEYKEKILELNNLSGMQIREIEEQLFDTDHAIVGGYLLGLWGLPDVIVEAAAFHHIPSSVGETNFSILSAVHLAHLSMKPQEIDQSYINALGIENEIPAFLNTIENSEVNNIE